MGKREPIEPVNIFKCSCGDEREFEFIDFKGHLLAAHNLKPEQLKGTKNMLMHLNGDGFHSYTYQWNLESGLQFMQYITRPKK